MRWIGFLVLAAAFLPGATLLAQASTEHPLEPRDRSSPRATLTTFLESIDLAWDLYESGDPGYEIPFRAARQSLDLSDIPPLVAHQVSAEAALLLKEILDRIELPPIDEIPDRAAVEALALTQWTVPHTEIRMVPISEGERQGQWIFSASTVERAGEYYELVKHLPYRPGRLGGHIEELRSGSRAVLLMKLASVMPSWFHGEIGGMMVWQLFGLALLVTLLVLAVLLLGLLARRWRKSDWIGHRAASFIVPLAMIAIPAVGGAMINLLIELPGAPALVVRLLFSIVGYFGFAWLAALVVTRAGELIIRVGFRTARPLKKQLVRVVYRVAAIVFVTAISLRAMQTLGVPIAGLIAGLGVGGLAIALAAQGTLENFIGGVILYADRPVGVGDFCRFGDQLGTVEDVGIRSVKVRTLGRTLVTVPNADFAKMQLENYAQRDRILLNEKIGLRYETTGAQLESVLSAIEEMLRADGRIAEDGLRVRFTGFREHSLELEVFAYALTSDWPEFLAIRQDQLVKIMKIIDESGTRLALPTEVHYAAGGLERAGST
jgi:MscS family membrane protein